MLNETQKQKIQQIKDKLEALRPENIIDEEKVAAKAAEERKIIEAFKAENDKK